MGSWADISMAPEPMVDQMIKEAKRYRWDNDSVRRDKGEPATRHSSSGQVKQSTPQQEPPTQRQPSTSGMQIGGQGKQVHSSMSIETPSPKIVIPPGREALNACTDREV